MVSVAPFDILKMSEFRIIMWRKDNLPKQHQWQNGGNVMILKTKFQSFKFWFTQLQHQSIHDHSAFGWFVFEDWQPTSVCTCRPAAFCNSDPHHGGKRVLAQPPNKMVTDSIITGGEKLLCPQIDNFKKYLNASPRTKVLSIFAGRGVPHNCPNIWWSCFFSPMTWLQVS